MKTFTAVVERDPATGWFKEYVPGFPARIPSRLPCNRRGFVTIAIVGCDIGLTMEKVITCRKFLAESGTAAN